MTKWNVTVNEMTDRLVRTHLARTGMKKGDLSLFVEEAARSAVLRKMAAQLREENPEAGEEEMAEALQSAVRRGMLKEIVEEVRERNAGDDPDELQAEIDEAVAWVRANPA